MATRFAANARGDQLTRLGLLTALTAAAIGVIYGYDLGAISGALLFLKRDFGLSTFMQEIVTSSVVAGSIVGALAGGPVTDWLGRKRTMVLVALAYAGFALLSGIALTDVWLITARFFLGVTIGLSVVATPVFVAELVPASRRGSLLVTYQIATTSGIAIAYFVDLALAPTGSWRLMLGISALPAVVIGLIVLRLPDTPRWYMMKGLTDKARETICRTDPSVDPEREMAAIRQEIEEEKQSSFLGLFQKRFARATVFVLGLGFLIQITGINAIVYYSPTIFQSMGFKSSTAAILVAAFVQVASVVAELGAFAIVDRLGRRPTLLTGILAMIAANALMIGLFIHGGFTGLSSALGFVGILVFTMGFNFGFGSLVWVYASESFPARLRTAGASAMLTMDLVANLIIGLVFLSAVKTLGGAWTFGVLGAFAVIAWVFVWWLAPETKGRPLEAIRYYWENGAQWPAEVPSEAADQYRTAS